jgi:benzylsuccinate CoA-transferase BbsE subunit
MAAHPRTDREPTESLPLRPIRVIEVTDAYGAYAGRLLADLGADVVRVEPPGVDPVRRREPLVDTPQGPASAFGWFVNLNKRSVALDLATPTGRDAFLALLAAADVLLESWRPGEADRLGLDEATIRAVAPELIRIAITPYGVEGPWSDRAATDLTTLAAGGLLSLGGYPDAEPVAVHGGQGLLAASIFGAVAALLGLVGRERDGVPRRYDVSAQEAIAAALEDAIPQYDLTGRVRRRAGDQPREAGTGIYACADGYVSMVAGRLGTARAWKALTEWLVEERVEGAEDLIEDRWQSFPYRQRQEAIDRFREIFERFTRLRTKEALYLEAQRRSIALAPVNEVADLFVNPQLVARGFFREVVPHELGRPVVVPGRPYRLGDEADVVLAPAPVLGAASAGAFPGAGNDPQPAAAVAPGRHDGPSVAAAFHDPAPGGAG